MASANDKLYRSADGHAWVGEHFEGSFPSNATHIADLPEEDDPRWRLGSPAFCDVEFITLSPFSPSGRLGVCVERKPSNPLGQYPNHPVFEGCKAWMPVMETRWTPIPQPDHARYVVLDENTLGYLIPEMPGYVGVLAGSVLKGGRDPMNGPALISPGLTKVRQATLDDFKSFRVMPPPCLRGSESKNSLGM
jgi:hypothetical protein